MFQRLLALITCILAAMFTYGLASADGQFGPESDILGFKLSMSQKQAKDYFTTHYKGSSFTMLPVELIDENYQAKSVAGFAFKDKKTNDRIAVMFNPNKGTDDVFAISRHTRFISQITLDQNNNPHVKGTLVLKQVVLDSLIKKYGEPTRVIRDPNNTRFEKYVWSIDQYDAISNNVCETDSGKSGYFSEPFTDDSDFKDIVQNVSQNFVNTINGYPANSIKLYEKCGVILSVVFWLRDISTTPSSHPPYIETLSEDLIDLTKGAHEFGKFGNDFYNGSHAAKEGKLRQNSTNRPNL